MAEKATKKATDETEKDQPARSAAPSAGRDERTFEEFQEASFALFDVERYVVVGAVLDAGLDTGEPLTRAEVERAVHDFLKREVK